MNPAATSHSVLHRRRPTLNMRSPARPGSRGTAGVVKPNCAARADRRLGDHVRLSVVQRVHVAPRLYDTRSSCRHVVGVVVVRRTMSERASASENARTRRPSVRRAARREKGGREVGARVRERRRVAAGASGARIIGARRRCARPPRAFPHAGLIPDTNIEGFWGGSDVKL